MGGKPCLVRIISYLYVIDDLADREKDAREKDAREKDAREKDAREKDGREKDGADRKVFFSPDRFGVCPYENLCFYSQFTDRKYCAS